MILLFLQGRDCVFGRVISAREKGKKNNSSISCCLLTVDCFFFFFAHQYIDKDDDKDIHNKSIAKC